MPSDRVFYHLSLALTADGQSTNMEKIPQTTRSDLPLVEGRWVFAGAAIPRKATRRRWMSDWLALGTFLFEDIPRRCAGFLSILAMAGAAWLLWLDSLCCIRHFWWAPPSSGLSDHSFQPFQNLGEKANFPEVCHGIRQLLTPCSFACRELRQWRWAAGMTVKLELKLELDAGSMAQVDVRDDTGVW
jgi:hypothetical protein